MYHASTCITGGFSHELCREHDAVFASERRVASEELPHHKTDTAGHYDGVIWDVC